VTDLLNLVRLPEGADVLGPVPAPGGRGEELERALLRVAPGQGAALASALKAAQIARLALRTAEPVRIRIDPTDIG
jgi:primosomal protein N' (replication factor Y)